LDDYSIKEKLYCITTDNAANNYTMARELNKLLTRDHIQWDHRTHHIPCLAHIINIVVQHFLKTLVIEVDDEDPNLPPSIDDDDDDFSDMALLATLEGTDDFNPASFSVILGQVRSIAKSIFEEVLSDGNSFNKPASLTISNPLQFQLTSLFDRIQHF